jgi:50S ribosomal protein L16 3-hydroxylase
MLDFARDAVARALRDPHWLALALGEVMTEPKPNVWFDAAPAQTPAIGALALDRRTRMMYDGQHIFINGESWRASGRDARLLRQLADARALPAADAAALSVGARALLTEWKQAGWLHDN